MDPFIYLEFLRRTLLPLPGVTEKLCFGTPAFYVAKKIFSRMKEDGETLVVQTVERDKWMGLDPGTFFITDHYRNYDYMLVNLTTVDPVDLEKLLLTAWHNRAPQKLRREYEENFASPQPSPKATPYPNFEKGKRANIGEKG